MANTYFQMHFHEWKILYFDSISRGFDPKGPIDNKLASIEINYNQLIIPAFLELLRHIWMPTLWLHPDYYG